MQASELVRCTVKSTRQLAPSIYEISFEAERPIRYEAGQWVYVRDPETDTTRPYSLASPPSVTPHQLCVKIVKDGPMSRFWESIRTGSVFEVSDGQGSFTYHEPAGRNVCFVAMGTGIAPIRAIIRSRSFQAAKPPASFCIIAAQNELDLIYGEEFRALPGMSWLPVICSPSPSWTGDRGLATERLKHMGDSFPWGDTDFYLCGSLDFVKDVKVVLSSHGVSDSSIHV